MWICCSVFVYKVCISKEMFETKTILGWFSIVSNVYLFHVFVSNRG